MTQTNNNWSFDLKRLIVCLYVCLFFAGCAASSYNSARSNANLVKNGMTIQEAVAVIGMAPTDETPTLLAWRRGTAQSYTATVDGAIVFQVRDGLIVDVPAGGIFSQEARRAFLKEWAAQRDQQAAQDTSAAAQDIARRNAESKEKAEKAEAERAANAVRVEAEIKAETEAAASANVTCNVKSSCAKIFALAQIYVATEADQKIQVVTDSVIQTYNPTEEGKVGASIIKMPQRGDGALVSLGLSCKVGQNGAFDSLCRIRKTQLYKGFKPFIERQLVQ